MSAVARAMGVKVRSSILLAGGLAVFSLVSCRSELESSSWRDISAGISRDSSVVASIDRRGVDAPALHLQNASSAENPLTLALDVSPLMPPVFDGERVLFLKRGVFHMSLMEVSVAGGEPVELASLRVSPQHLTCLTSSSRIVFLCFMEGYFGVSTTIKAYDLKTGVLRDYTELPSCQVESAALSGDGRVLVFSDGRSLWTLDLESGLVSDISSKVVGLDRPLHMAISWDGSLLCLRLGRLESKDVGNNGDFAKPDLSKIKYKTVDNRSLQLVDLKGVQPQRKLASGEDARQLRFSPDSTRLAFIEGSKIRIISLDSGTSLFIPCPRYEFGGFLTWFGNDKLVCREFGAPHSDARLLLIPADGKGSPCELLRQGQKDSRP